MACIITDTRAHAACACCAIGRAPLDRFEFVWPAPISIVGEGLNLIPFKLQFEFDPRAKALNSQIESGYSCARAFLKSLSVLSFELARRLNNELLERVRANYETRGRARGERGNQRTLSFAFRHPLLALSLDEIIRQLIWLIVAALLARNERRPSSGLKRERMLQICIARLRPSQDFLCRSPGARRRFASSSSSLGLISAGDYRQLSPSFRGGQEVSR